MDCGAVYALISHGLLVPRLSFTCSLAMRVGGEVKTQAELHARARGPTNCEAAMGEWVVLEMAAVCCVCMGVEV